jgi:hypothetical protein
VTSELDRTSLRRYARATGVLYLVIIVCAGFAEGYVRSTLVVPGDPAATAGAILASEGLFRLGFAADLVAFLADAAVAVLFYVLLEHVDRTIALLAAAFRLVAHPAIASINLLNHFEVLLLLGDGGASSSFDAGELEAMASISLQLHRYGYLIAGAFFGVHCALLGHLLARSELFPRVLGVLMAVASFGYLTESFTMFLAPRYETAVSVLIVVTAGVAELSLCLWLLVKGVRDPGPAR